MLKRKIEKKLIAWKNTENRKPLIIKGCRQCGKTFSVLDFAKKNYKNVVYLNFFENPDYVSAIVGITEEGRVVYSWEKMITHLVETDGMTEEDAIDFISYNTERAIPYAGPMAPIILYPIPGITEE